MIACELLTTLYEMNTFYVSNTYLLSATKRKFVCECKCILSFLFVFILILKTFHKLNYVNQTLFNFFLYTKFFHHSQSFMIVILYVIIMNALYIQLVSIEDEKNKHIIRHNIVQNDDLIFCPKKRRRRNEKCQPNISNWKEDAIPFK